jgi:hypothetical protein
MRRFMNQLCDLYFPVATQSNRLKFITIFDKNFVFDAEKIYQGYLGVNIKRIKLISILDDLRKNKIQVFSAPIAYRDQKNISEENAFQIAKEHSQKENKKIDRTPQEWQSFPAYFRFPLTDSDDTSGDKAGGSICIDRLDGHVWTNDESEEYFYDYNNLF